MRFNGSDGEEIHSGTLSEIQKTLFSYSISKAREWLLLQMLKKGLATRDVISFVRKQANLRLEVKTLDNPTVKAAMKAKLMDIKINKSKLLKKLGSLKKILLESLDGKTFRLRKHMNRLKAKPKELELKKITAFKKKLEHYGNKQGDLTYSDRVQKGQENEENFPSKLSAYKQLNIFKHPNEFPKKTDPLGPFICDKNIKLSTDELKILSKQPKFSVMGEVTRIDMLLETERMLGKHRLQSRNKPNDSITTARLDLAPTEKSYPSDDPMARGGSNINAPIDQIGQRGGYKDKTDMEDINRKQDLMRVWQENEDRFIHNPLSNSIDFRNYRPTDYTLNKRIHMPKPMKVDQELECEIRRRDYMRVFDNYINEKIPSNANTKGQTDGSTVNLTTSEKRGLKSLRARMKRGEL